MKHLHDIVFIFGLASFGYGLYRIDLTVCVLGVGTILMFLGLALARKSAFVDYQKRKRAD